MMIDYKQLELKLYQKVMDATKEHASIIEEKLKEVISLYNCKPSQIELEVCPNFKYKIKILASQFDFDYSFKMETEE